MTGKMTADINELASKITVPKAVYKRSHVGNRNIKFTLDGDIELSEKHSKNLLYDFVHGAARMELYGNKIKSSEINANTFKQTITKTIMSFIYNNTKSPNPKLTKLYRYYRDIYITDDMYALWKYMRTYDRSDDRHEPNIMAILKLLMERDKNGTMG